MSGIITKQQLQDFLDGQISPEKAELLKQRLYEKFFAKAIWAMENHGISEASQLDFAIEVSLDPPKVAERSEAESSGDPDQIMVTLNCCTGAGCGICISFGI
ncbi:hypothetical protein [Ponticaulis sp.]|uniref:hypothetical protein n=1 Tax=Ponticaulis sp. TaxID=2020902 RepID=UPI0025DAC5DE|nr:hypothetical protein [Ponticaulis sp.]